MPVNFDRERRAGTGHDSHGVDDQALGRLFEVERHGGAVERDGEDVELDRIEHDPVGGLGDGEVDRDGTTERDTPGQIGLKRTRSGVGESHAEKRYGSSVTGQRVTEPPAPR
ncbi:MAG: hypothetical protein V9G18_12905 [Albidovulum sp.]